jgi:hypothetical protein
MMHIKQTLPDIKARIASSLSKYQAELASLGNSMLGNSSNIVLNMITEFTNEYRGVLDGNNQELSATELSGGARISFVYHELYANGVKAVDPFDQVKDMDIRTVLYNSSGSSPALFVGTTAFEVIVKQQIKRLEDPSLKCVSLVYDELIRILGQLLNKNAFRRYPGLKEKLHQVVVSFFKKAMDPTNKLVRDLVAMESVYINTGHPDFINGSRAMAIVHERHNSARPQQVDPKTGKPLPPTVPPRSSSPSLDPNDGGGFFGSFFASKNKKKMAAMEPPPPTLKASGTLSEKESQEVEVISKFDTAFLSRRILTSHRTADHLLLQHRPPHNDRHGPQSYHVEPRPMDQGEHARRAPHQHVQDGRARRAAQGVGVHGQEAEGLPADGGEFGQGPGDCQPSTVGCCLRGSLLDSWVWHSMQGVLGASLLDFICLDLVHIVVDV